MRLPASFLFGFALLSCKEIPKEVDISETRVLTTKDEAPVLNATSAQQFLPEDLLKQIEGKDSLHSLEKSGKWTYDLPTGWKQGPQKPLRDVNLTFGEGGNIGEVYLSVVGGGVKPNTDRWYRQFSQPIQELAAMAKVPFLEGEGYLVSTSGRYEPGMGRPGKENQGLLGVLAEKEGSLITVKMIGPAEEVLAQREQFLSFIASLKQGE